MAGQLAVTAKFGAAADQLHPPPRHKRQLRWQSVMCINVAQSVQGGHSENQLSDIAIQGSMRHAYLSSGILPAWPCSEDDSLWHGWVELHLECQTMSDAEQVDQSSSGAFSQKEFFQRPREHFSSCFGHLFTGHLLMAALNMEPTVGNARVLAMMWPIAQMVDKFGWQGYCWGTSESTATWEQMRVVCGFGEELRSEE